MIMKLCRTCLNGDTQKNLADLQIILATAHANETRSNLDIMNFCLGIKIQPHEYNNTKLCLKCYKALKSFYEFKQKALKCDLYFTSLKTEDIYPDFFEIESNKNKDVFFEDHNQVFELTNAEDVCFANEELKNKRKDNECSQEYNETEIKQELSDHFESDDEFLSVIKLIKDENVEINKNNEDIQFAEPTRRKAKPKTKQKAKLETEIKPKQRTKEKSKKEHDIEGICDKCGKHVKRLGQHLQIHRSQKERQSIPCKQCDRLFSTHSARYRHVKFKHRGFKEHCDICNKDVVCLKPHILMVHQKQELPYPCLACDRRFISPWLLAAHVTSHTEDRPFTCDICQKRFRCNAALVAHTRQVHLKEKSHMCQFCSKSFFKKDNLLNHVRMHTKERPYECRKCGKRFSTARVCKQHEDTHNPDKKYKCELCDMTFARKSYVRVHLISHTRERKHACSFCGVKFGRSDHRKRHEFTAHLKQNRRQSEDKTGDDDIDTNA